MGLKTDLGGIQYIVVRGFRRKNGNFRLYKTVSREIKMPSFNLEDQFEQQKMQIDSLTEIQLSADEDLLMEQILENINTTPIGQVLKNIVSLPEVRQKKVLNVRRQITESRYDLNERLDVALDKVLESLTA